MPVIAVLFRDSDGTASSGRGLWEDKRKSIEDGFGEAGFDYGVPMIPKPKSEAWLLCAFHGYQRGDEFGTAFWKRSLPKLSQKRDGIALPIDVGGGRERNGALARPKEAVAARGNNDLSARDLDEEYGENDFSACELDAEWGCNEVFYVASSDKGCGAVAGVAKGTTL